MKRSLLCLLVLLTLLSGLLVTTTRVAHAASSSCINPNGTNVLQGTLGGASYVIAVPSNWNGTLVLYSHGYVFPGQPNPAPTVALTGAFGAAFLQQGYALAGSSYSQTGWAVQQAFTDQIALLDFFDATCGTPTRTIAAGHSEGGLISAGLVQLYPDRFAGALPMSGALAGGIGNWNQGLDSAFAFDVLLAGSALPIVHITDPTGAFNQAEQILAQAQSSLEGRARIALVAALVDLPGWIDPFSPEPASTDFTTQEQNQEFLLESHELALGFFGRADLEFRAGGNPSWNTGVDYHVQLAKSADNEEVQALYQQAGLNLSNDLDTLNAAPRISADPGAVGYLNQYITFNGELNVPVLTMHTTGDVSEEDQAYASVVQSSGDTSLLRQVFVHRGGHGTFTPAETLTAFQTLIHRLDTGSWDGSTNPDLMNQEATALGPSLNVLPSPFPNGTTLIPTPPAFFNFEPPLFLRPFPSNGSQ